VAGARQHAHRRAAELGRHLVVHRRRRERIVGADDEVRRRADRGDVAEVDLAPPSPRAT
jgi:hypothetical protein